MVEIQNLWPDFNSETMPSPKKMMIEQAAFLKEKTNGRVYAKVVNDSVKYYDEDDGDDVDIKLLFQVVVPALGNYRYTLFRAVHGVRPYPVIITYGEKKFDIQNMEELTKTLSNIFNSEDTIKKISTLLSYE